MDSKSKISYRSDHQSFIDLNSKSEKDIPEPDLEELRQQQLELVRIQKQVQDSLSQIEK